MSGPTGIKARLVEWARELKAELRALGHAARDPRTPWYAKALALLVIAYAVSPIDLIPDFLPVIGVVDDLILVPLGIALVLHFIPPEVMAEHRQRDIEAAHVPMKQAGFILLVTLWVAALLALAALMHRWFW